MNIDIAYTIAIEESLDDAGVIDYKKAIQLFYELLNANVTWH